MYWLTGVIGMLFLIAPFSLGYSNDPVITEISLIIGLVVTFISLLQGVVAERKWEDMTITFFGIFAVLAPFILGFFTHTTETFVYLVGGLIIVIAGYTMYMKQIKYK